MSLEQTTTGSLNVVGGEIYDITNDQDNRQTMNAPNKDNIAFVPTTNDDEEYVAMNDHQSLESSEITAETNDVPLNDRPIEFNGPPDELSDTIENLILEDKKKVSITKISNQSVNDNRFDDATMQRFYTGQGAEGDFLQNHNKDKGSVEPAAIQAPTAVPRTRDNNDAKAKMGVINAMPELKWYAWLHFIQNTRSFNLPEDIARIYCHLLKKLEEIESHYPHQPVYDRYQIELRRIRKDSPLCQVFLRVHSLQWYNLEKGKDEHIQEKTHYYIQQVEQEHEDDGFRSDLKPDNSYKRLKNRYRCKTKVQVNGRWKECGFFVKNHYCIYETSEFYVFARFDGTPVITICPKQHCQNEYWVQTPAAWNAVMDVLEYIKKELGLSEWPLHRIYVNFRNWHSQVRGGRRDGHAHINIVVTPEAIKACKGTNSKLRCLADSDFSPPDYRRSDKDELKKLLAADVSNLSDNDKVDEETSSNKCESDSH